MPEYLLDANVFIEAKNRYYQFSFCPAFWEWLVVQNEQGTIASIHRIRDELINGDEEFVNWVNTNENLFLPVNIHEIEPYLRNLTNWVNELDKPDAKK